MADCIMSAWPEIDGIDSAEARGRWCDDLGLFKVMLERLLEESIDVANAAPTQDPDTRALCIQSMHRLRGGACMLGAKAIFKLAGEVEATCASGEIERAKILANKLAIELQRMRSSAERVFIAASSGSDDSVSTVDLELGPYLIVELDNLEFDDAANELLQQPLVHLKAS
jgi:HPt (histidine-containing phosphotransfer) domain-containing protein